MTILVIVGMPASGKNIARMYADSKNIPYYATGDVVREEVKKRGLEPNAENTAVVSTELRGIDGMGVTRKALLLAIDTKNSLVFLEGMRSWPEIELIRKNAACIVVAFLAPKTMRLNRITSRGRPDDSPDAFEERDMREIAYGTATPIVLADEYILNTGGMEDASAKLEQIIESPSVPI